MGGNFFARDRTVKLVSDWERRRQLEVQEFPTHKPRPHARHVKHTSDPDRVLIKNILESDVIPCLLKRIKEFTLPSHVFLFLQITPVIKVRIHSFLIDN